MKNYSEKIVQDFGRACYKNNVVGLCITINEKDNTNAVALNATAHEAGFMIRNLVERLAAEYVSDDEEYADFYTELLKFNLTKKTLN